VLRFAVEGRQIRVVAESIGRFSVDRIVTNHAVLVRHAKWDTADVLDEAHDEGGDDLINMLVNFLTPSRRRNTYDIPSDDEHGTCKLPSHLLWVTCNCSTRRSESESSTSFGGREDTDQETTGNTGDQMGMEDFLGMISDLQLYGHVARIT
jgi:hypothetical protein